MTSTKQLEEQKEFVRVMKYALEQSQNKYYEAQADYRETQIKYDQAVIKLNWMKEELEGSRSV